MKKRGNQDFPFNDVSSANSRIGDELARPADHSVEDTALHKPSAAASRPVTAQDTNPSFEQKASSRPVQRVNDFSSLYEAPSAASYRPEEHRKGAAEYPSNGYSDGYSTQQRTNLPRRPQDAQTTGPSKKHTLNQQMQVLSVIAAIMLVIVLILLYFAIFGGRKDAANAAGTDPLSSTTSSVDPSALESTTTVTAALVTTIAGATDTTTAAPTQDTDPSSLANLPPSSENPVIALTFDDGPSGTLTPELLDVLKEKGVHVTFFLLGVKVADADPALIKRMLDEGHEIGNHSYDHSIYTDLTEEEIRTQLQKTNDLIFAATGIYPKVMRPPTGGSNDTVLKVSKDMGMATVNWSWESCPEDWLEDHQTPEFISNHVVTNAANGHIVLLHDIHECTVDSIASMIDGLRAKGYRFATVSDLLNTLPGGMQNGVLYYYGRE